MTRSPVLTAFALTTWFGSVGGPAAAQQHGIDAFRREMGRALIGNETREARRGARQPGGLELHFENRSDSLDWLRGKKLADRSSGFRVIVSLQARHIWVIADEDTLMSAPAAVAKGTVLTFAGETHHFVTPRGMRTVLDKDSNPVWQPPDWFYFETAKENGFQVARVPSAPGSFIRASDGRKITVQNNRVGAIDEEGFAEFPTDLHVIVGDTLFLPPLGTDNRKVAGTLGKYKLNLGDGYMLHGTANQKSIGFAATHGCVRLHDEDIEWLFENVPVGTRVFIY